MQILIELLLGTVIGCVIIYACYRYFIHKENKRFKAEMRRLDGQI